MIVLLQNHRPICQARPDRCRSNADFAYSHRQIHHIYNSFCLSTKVDFVERQIAHSSALVITTHAAHVRSESQKHDHDGRALGFGSIPFFLDHSNSNSRTSFARYCLGPRHFIFSIKIIWFRFEIDVNPHVARGFLRQTREQAYLGKFPAQLLGIGRSFTQVFL